MRDHSRRLDALERTSANPDSIPATWALDLDRNIAELASRTGIELPPMPSKPGAMFTACAAFLDRAASSLSARAVDTVRVGGGDA